MATEFKVDHSIHGLARDLKAISDEFGDAEDFSDDLAEAVGNDGLADEVRDFATKWNKKRTEMKNNVDFVHALIKALGDGTDQIDSDLQKAIKQEKHKKGGKP